MYFPAFITLIILFLFSRDELSLLVSFIIIIIFSAVTFHIFFRMRRFFMTLDTIDVLCLVYSNFCANMTSLQYLKFVNDR